MDWEHHYGYMYLIILLGLVIAKRSYEWSYYQARLSAKIHYIIVGFVMGGILFIGIFNRENTLFVVDIAKLVLIVGSYWKYSGAYLERK